MLRATRNLLVAVPIVYTGRVITVLTGNNNYEISVLTRQRQAQFDGAVERVDGTDLDLNRLADLLAGGGLFSLKKLVIISELSANKTIWPVLGDWLGRVDSDTELILVEPKLDKRTAGYKALKSAAEIKELNNWSDRDQSVAVRWTIEEAGNRGLKLDREVAAEVVRRCLVAADRPGRLEIDQWRIHFAIDKLRAVDKVDLDVVNEIIAGEAHENSFEILELAISGNLEKLQRRLEVLHRSEEPHRLFGLLTSQIYQLAVLTYSAKPAAGVAADIGAHPFVIEKLQPAARTLGKAKVRDLVFMFADTDRRLKSTGQDAWQLVESLLLTIATKK